MLLPDGRLSFNIPLEALREGLPLTSDLELISATGSSTLSGVPLYLEPAYPNWVGQPAGPYGTLLDPLGDEDRDGLFNVVEYVMDLDPRSPEQVPPSLVVDSDGPPCAAQVTLRFRRNPHASDALVVIEESEDLLSWRPVPLAGFATVLDPDPDGDGSAMLYEVTLPSRPACRMFYRLGAALLQP